MTAVKIIGLALLSLVATLSGVAGGQFSSNVVMLNSRNWRKEVEESGHAIFVNVWCVPFPSGVCTFSASSFLP
jgi:hypothetical protein